MSLEENVTRSFELYKKECDTPDYIKDSIDIEYTDRFDDITNGILMPLSVILAIGGFLVCFTGILALQIIGLFAIIVGVSMPLNAISFKMAYLEEVEEICDRLLEVADTPTEDVEYEEVEEFHPVERTFIRARQPQLLKKGGNQ